MTQPPFFPAWLKIPEIAAAIIAGVGGMYGSLFVAWLSGTISFTALAWSILGGVALVLGFTGVQITRRVAPGPWRLMAARVRPRRQAVTAGGVSHWLGTIGEWVRRHARMTAIGMASVIVVGVPGASWMALPGPTHLLSTPDPARPPDFLALRREIETWTRWSPAWTSTRADAYWQTFPRNRAEIRGVYYRALMAWANQLTSPSARCEALAVAHKAIEVDTTQRAAHGLKEKLEADGSCP